MIKTVKQLQEQIIRASDIIDAISFRESVKYNDFRLLQKVQRALFKLSLADIVEGVLIL